MAVDLFDVGSLTAPVSFLVNPWYFGDAVAGVTDDTATVSYVDALKPVMVLGSDWTALVMPIRETQPEEKKATRARKAAVKAAVKAEAATVEALSKPADPAPVAEAAPAKAARKRAPRKVAVPAADPAPVAEATEQPAEATPTKPARKRAPRKAVAAVPAGPVGVDVDGVRVAVVTHTDISQAPAPAKRAPRARKATVKKEEVTASA